jgi:hypothetical protein
LKKSIELRKETPTKTRMAIRSKKTITAVSPEDSPERSADPLPKERYLFSVI